MLYLFREQPRAFSLIFLLELWERFGFYTVQGILTLYFIRHLGFTQVQSYNTFGAFSALLYGMVSLGGYLGDKLLGTKRTIALGLVALTLGYFALAFTDKEHVFLAIGLICVGNGIFKANPSNLLSKCYEPGDRRLHGGFTLYYMAINLGSIFALFLGPYISSAYGYSYAYLMASMGLFVGLCYYAINRHVIACIHTPADEYHLRWFHWGAVILGVMGLTYMTSFLLQHIVFARNLLWCVAFVVLLFYVFLMSREARTMRIQMAVALVLMLEGVLFFTLYQQMPTSLNLFAVHHIIPTLLGIPIDPQSFQVLNPLWIVSMSPVLVVGYRKFQVGHGRTSLPYKFALGMTVTGISFLVLYFARYTATESGMVSSWWLVLSYLFQSLGELLISALGLAMVAELVPPHVTGFIMGMWFLSSSISGFLGAYVASYTAIPQHMLMGMPSLMVYTDVFAYIGLVTLGVALVMWLSSPYLKKVLLAAEVK